MDPTRILLDALNDSVTSGTFIDTKFYVFSRKEASGRVGSPRALYCNSRVLKTVPYFSSCVYPGSLQYYASDRIAPKCSRMPSRKDNRGTSSGNSPPAPPPLRSTTTYLIVISRMNPHALKRSTRNPLRVIVQNCHQAPALIHVIQGCKRLQPRPWGSH